MPAVAPCHVLGRSPGGAVCITGTHHCVLHAETWEALFSDVAHAAAKVAGRAAPAGPASNGSTLKGSTEQQLKMEMFTSLGWVKRAQHSNCGLGIQAISVSRARAMSAAPGRRFVSHAQCPSLGDRVELSADEGSEWRLQPVHKFRVRRWCIRNPPQLGFSKKEKNPTHCFSFSNFSSMKPEVGFARFVGGRWGEGKDFVLRPKPGRSRGG